MERENDKFKIIIPPQDIACDPGLLEQLSGGNRDAYAWVYKNYCRKIYDYAFLITGNDTQSEDIVQDVFFKLWQHREKLKKVENFNSYLNVLCRNLVIDTLKARQKEISVRQIYFQENTTPVILPDEQLLNKEQHHVINQAVKKLPPQRKAVYMMRREFGWKRGDIAKELKITSNTVKAQMQKSLQFLKQYVLDRME